MTEITRRQLLIGASTCCVGSTSVGAEPNFFRPICTLRSYPDFKYAETVSAADPEAARAVALIADTIGIAPNFEVLKGDFNAKVGAFATVRGGRRYIVYDDAEFWFEDGHTDWRSLGVLCHELGHHAATHVYVTDISDHAQELEADRFAGVALARLGASLEQALLWTGDLNEKDTPTHPARIRREVAVIDGWQRAQALMGQEKPHCAPVWQGDPFEIDARQCRLAMTCEDRERLIRLACEAYDGSWQWVSGSKK